MSTLSAPERPAWRAPKPAARAWPTFALRLKPGAARAAEPELTRAATDAPGDAPGDAMLRATTLLKRPVAALPKPAVAQVQAKAQANAQANAQATTQAGARASARTQAPRDRAPSRLAYRIERLRLTPTVRIFLRYGLPVLLVAAVTGGILASADRRAAIMGQVTTLRDVVENRPEFMVRLLEIDGASPPVADAVRAMMPATMPVSSFKIDLAGFHDAIARMDAVETVMLKVRSGGVLTATVVERKPAVLWRNGNSLEMLDATGHRVATLLERAARPDLPVIGGEGAEAAVPEALAILSAARPILPKVRGLVRVGDRRWDIVLDGDRRILLPQDRPIPAVEEAIALDKSQDLLSRDIAQIDFRNADRPTLRLGAAAMAAEHPDGASPTTASPGDSQPKVEDQ